MNDKDKQSEIVPARWSSEHKLVRQSTLCVHGHTGLCHPKCFEKEQGIKERIGCIDIEAGGLKANVDIMLSWAIKTFDGEEIWYDHITPKDLSNGIYDKNILQTLVNTMWKYDRLVGHYADNYRFDIPFIRTRALMMGVKGFPAYGQMYITDTYALSKKYLKLTSNRQDCIGESLLPENIKTRVNFKYWLSVKYGNDTEKKKAIAYIVEHNLKDCEQLEDNYRILRQFGREVRVSI